MGRALLDPGEGRGRENLVPGLVECREIRLQGFGFLLREGKRPGEGLAAAPLGDELHEVRHPPLFSLQFGLLEADRCRDLRAHLADFLLNSLEDVRDVLRGGELFLDRAEDNLLGNRPPNDSLKMPRIWMPRFASESLVSSPSATETTLIP